MQNVWDRPRQNNLRPTVWDADDAIVEAGSIAWSFLMGDLDRIRSIGARATGRLGDWAIGRLGDRVTG